MTVPVPLPPGPGRARAACPARLRVPVDDRSRGAGVVLVLGLIGVVIVLISGVCLVGAAMLARHRAEAVADLAALAAAAGDRPDCARAFEVARQDGGGLISCSIDPVGNVTVAVAVPVAIPATGAGGPAATVAARAGQLP